MENFVNVKLEFNDKTLSTLVANLNSTYLNCQSNFVDICIGVYKIWDYCKGNYWKAKDNEYYNSYKLLEKFGFDKKAVGEPVSYWINYKNPRQKIRLYPIPNKRFDYKVVYNQFRPVMGTDYATKFEFTSADDFLNLPENLELLFMDCRP